MDAKRLIGYIQSQDLEPMSYSGRAMYGARCVAVTLGARESMALGARLASAVMDDTDWVTNDLGVEAVLGELANRVAAVRNLMAEAREDQMGRDDHVVYWPEVAWPEDVCDRCGGDKKPGQSCDCADNGGE